MTEKNEIDPLDAEFLKDPVLKRGLFVSRLVWKHGFAPVLLTAVLAAFGYGLWWLAQEYVTEQKKLLVKLIAQAPKEDIDEDFRRRKLQDEAIISILSEAKSQIGDVQAIRLVQTHNGVRSFSGYLFMYCSTTHELGNEGISLGTQKLPVQAIQTTFNQISSKAYLVLDNDSTEHLNYQRLLMVYGVKSAVLVQLKIVNQGVFAGWLEADFASGSPDMGAIKFLASASRQIGAVLYDRKRE